MRGPWTRTVAREDFELRLPGAEPRTVTVEVGEPYLAEEGEWACPVALQGLDGRLADIRGTSSLQALCLALSLVRPVTSSATG